uniref:Uncharacterized protein n=1 Tax=Kalanchoe fedtschenkoi TaxID=63787 RepID=A0A7N1A532_KALFE
MGSLQGPVIVRNVSAKQAGGGVFPAVRPVTMAAPLGVAAWVLKRNGLRNKVEVISHPQSRSFTKPQCSLSSSSGGSGSMAENFKENDSDYVNSSVVDAVEVKSGTDGFVIRMRDGSNLQCVHNNPQGAHVREYAPHPAISLKNNSDLMNTKDGVKNKFS